MPPTAPQRQRLALLLQYDGAAFAGSQWQPQLPTVQGALEHAVSQLTQERSRISLAGRTDAGVHATGQVASFETVRRMPVRRWLGGLNHFLPAALAVQALQAVPSGFDPRRDALEREYRYELLIAPQRRPLVEQRVWRLPPPFSLEAARAALAQLEGRHDFAAFTAADQRRPTQRCLRSAVICAARGRFTLSFTADAFLQHQVRRMVGAVVEVARARSTPEALRNTLEAAVPGSAGPTAPARGLTLAAVRYDRAVLREWKLDHADDCPEPA